MMLAFLNETSVDSTKYVYRSPPQTLLHVDFQGFREANMIQAWQTDGNALEASLSAINRQLSTIGICHIQLPA